MHHEPGKIGHIVKSLVRDASRNAIIVECVRRAYAKQRHILVLSDFGVDKYLDLLRALLVKSGIPVSHMAYYTGESLKAEITRAKSKEALVVLGTYGMASESTDVPHWDTLVLATPRANVMQSIGRILRTHPGKKQPIVFDIVDTDSHVLENYAKARFKVYTSKEVNAEVLKIDI
jgi:superfamily II DNA or RNA helicase